MGLALARITTWPLAWLPPAWGLALGAAGGRLAFRLWTKRRDIALANLEMIKAGGGLPPDLDSRAVAREAFANMGRNGWEAIRFFHRGLEPFTEYCRVEEGERHLEEAVAECRRTGRGLLLTTGHMGNWEVMCQYLSRAFGVTLNIVGRNSGQPLADALIERLRTRIGNRYISKRGGAREMIGVLKSGGVLGTLIDQAVLGNHPGALIPFLGREATTNLGPIRLARRTGAKVILVLFRRQGPYNYMKILPVLEPRTDLGPEAAILAEARQLNDWLSEHIKRYPDQWMWGHRRWKTKRGVRRDRQSIT